jgi:hypothetical protein
MLIEACPPDRTEPAGPGRSAPAGPDRSALDGLERVLLGVRAAAEECRRLTG